MAAARSPASWEPVKSQLDLPIATGRISPLDMIVLRGKGGIVEVSHKRRSALEAVVDSTRNRRAIGYATALLRRVHVPLQSQSGHTSSALESRRARHFDVRPDERIYDPRIVRCCAGQHAFRRQRTRAARAHTTRHVLRRGAERCACTVGADRRHPRAGHISLPRIAMLRFGVTLYCAFWKAMPNEPDNVPTAPVVISMALVAPARA
jgi:hypothetical protein